MKTLETKKEYISNPDVDELGDDMLFSGAFYFLWRNGSDNAKHLAELKSYDERAAFVRMVVRDAFARCGLPERARVEKVFPAESKAADESSPEDFSDFRALFFNEAQKHLDEDFPVSEEASSASISRDFDVFELEAPYYFGEGRF